MSELARRACMLSHRPSAKFRSSRTDWRSLAQEKRWCAWKRAAFATPICSSPVSRGCPWLPLTLGHEGIGRVEATGPGVSNVRPGDRVGVTFLAETCGECELCRNGLERYCARQLNSGYTAHGALATFAVVRTQQLAKIPEALDAAEAAPICCAGWTAYGAVRESGLRAGQLLAIFGMGGLGHMAQQYAAARGLRTAAVDISEEKLRAAAAQGAGFSNRRKTAEPRDSETARRGQRRHRA